MNPTESTSGNLPVAGWHVLGEIELTIGSNPDGNLRDRLTEILVPLHLHDGFLNKVLTSAQEYTLRAAQNTETGHGRIHLAILVQEDHRSPGNIWGFFHIEKIDSAEGNLPHPDHTIEYYLYLEGQ